MHMCVYVYVYLHLCVCVCVCLCVQERVHLQLCHLTDCQSCLRNYVSTCDISQRLRKQLTALSPSLSPPPLSLALSLSSSSLSSLSGGSQLLSVASMTRQCCCSVFALRPRVNIRGVGGWLGSPAAGRQGLEPGAIRSRQY